MSIQKNENLFSNISKIFYAEIPEGVTSDISTITDNGDGTVSATFNSGKDWKEIYMTKGSASFSQKHKIVDEGDIFEQTLSFNFPGESLESQNQLKSLLRKPLVLKIETTHCGIVFSKMVGSLETPVFYSENLKSAEYNANRDISLYCESTQPAPYLV